MADVIEFVPKFKTPERNLAGLIETYREGTRYKDQGGFGVDEWKTTTTNRPQSIRFSVYDDGKTGKEFTPFPEPFSLIAKSYISWAQRDKESSSIRISIVALQLVYDALKNENGHADILQMDGHVQTEATRLNNERYPGSDTRHKYGLALKRFYEFLIAKKIVPNLPVWKNQWSKPKAKMERTDKAGRDFQETKMPSVHQIIRLADCFFMAETKKDLYWSRKALMLMHSPGRCGELEDLTIDCLGEEEGRHFVGWYSAKGFGANPKWIPDLLLEFVKEAVADLIEISRPAREAAKWAYDHPEEFYRHSGCITPPDFPEDKPLTAMQFAAAMNLDGTLKKFKGYDPDSEIIWKKLKEAKWVQGLLKKGPITYRALAEYTLDKYKDKNWPNFRNTNRPIWECLTLVRENEFHEDFEPKAFSWRIPSVDEMNWQLGPREMENPPPSLFQRFGLKDEDGSEIDMTSHMVRRWLHTIGQKGGVDEWILAQWAGRKDIRQSKHYSGMTEAEKVEAVAALMIRTKPPTALEAVKTNLPVTYESLGLDRIGVAHITEYGVCTHAYSMSPCTKGGECVTCKEHVNIKGMPKTLERMKEYEARIRIEFEKARDAAEDSVFGADRWYTCLGWKLAHIAAQIRRMEDPETPEGTVLWIPPQHDPSPVKRSLGEAGHNISTGAETPDIDFGQLFLED